MPPKRKTHLERHRTDRIGWLRAAVLGANDGIVSTASLMIGVAAANASRGQFLLAGAAGLTAGALSMAAGEYVSVSSQADTEEADLAKERAELAAQPELEKQELANIYVGRGLTRDLAEKVAEQLTEHGALDAHARDELGITERAKARPTQAALASAASFALGAALPLLTGLFAPRKHLILTLAMTSLLFLVGLGCVAARIGGAPPLKAALRVAFWGALAMAVTAVVGHIFAL
jgi:VIT1/CCC1 family predicted Fe2+/Mn2+ transporter